MMKLIHLLAAACAVPSICLAQTERELDSHDHGAGSLNIAIEGNLLLIEFEAPWDNLVGFEHSPETDEQIKLVEDALMALETPKAFFTFNGTGCIATNVNIENSMSMEKDDEHGHEEEHGHENADKKDSHSSVYAVYSFDCRDTSRLESIDVSVFDMWQRFEELDVQLIGPGGAAAMEITPENTSLDLAQVI